jgi:sphingosine kinase
MTSDSGSTNCKKVKELPKIDTSYLSEGPVPSSTTSSNKSESYIPAEQMVYSSAVSRNNEVNRSNLENNDLAGSAATLTYGRLSIPKVMKMFIKNKLYFNEKGIIVKDLSTLPGFESLKKKHFNKLRGFKAQTSDYNDDLDNNYESMGLQQDDDEEYDDDHQSHRDSRDDTLSVISCMSCLSTNSLATLDHPEERSKLLNEDDAGTSIEDLSDNQYLNATLEPDVEIISKNDLKLKTIELPNNSIIPFRNILNCKVLNWKDYEANEFKVDSEEMNDFEFIVEIVFAKNRRADVIPRSSIIRCSYEEYQKLMKMCQYDELEDEDNTKQPTLKELILFKAFPNPVERNRILVIINPNGGKGKAHKIFHSKSKPILLASSKAEIHIKETTYHREAYHFIKNHPNLLRYNIICCASGDGIPHEVLNAIYHRKDRSKIFQEMVISQIPCGSGNALSLSCHGTNNASLASLNILKGRVEQVDLMTCQQESYKDNIDKIDDEEVAQNTRVSFLSQAYGIIAESDINTEYLRFIGPSRFEIGVTSQVLRKKKYPCDVMVQFGKQNKHEVKQHYLENLKQKTRDQHSGTGIFDEELNANVYTFDGKQEFRTLSDNDLLPKYHLSDTDVNELPDPSWCLLDSSITKNLNIFYGGKMPYIAPDTKFFPAAIHNDAFIDLVLSDSKTSISRMASILLNLDKGHHVIQPEVTHLKVKAFRLIPHVSKTVLSVDGEKFPLEPLQCEVLPKVCKMVLMEQGGFKETGFESM